MGNTKTKQATNTGTVINTVDIHFAEVTNLDTIVHLLYCLVAIVGLKLLI